jgi:hypothetical protein
MGKQPTREALEHTGCVLDGRDDALLRWSTDSGTTAIAADKYAVEAYPATHRSGCTMQALRRFPSHHPLQAGGARLLIAHAR